MEALTIKTFKTSKISTVEVSEKSSKGFNYQVIPENLQKYVSTNRSLLQCKTLPAHFSNNMTVYCLLNVIQKQNE